MTDDATGPSMPGNPNEPAAAPPPPPPGAAPGQSPPPPGFGPPSSAAPGQPPAYGTPPPAPGQWPASGDAAAPAAPPPGFAPTSDGGMVKGPRPDVKVGGILVTVGAVLSLIGVFLPWVSGDGASVNGMDNFAFISDGDFYIADSPGSVPIFFAVIMLGLGLALVFAGRVLAVAIIAIVGAVIAEFIGLAMVGIASGQADFIDGANIGVGAILQPIAPLLSLAGAIVATSKRRRMVPANQGAPAPGAPPTFG